MTNNDVHAGTSTRSDFLRSVAPRLHEGDAEAVHFVVLHLRLLRSQYSPAEWQLFCRNFKTTHAELWTALVKCPMTSHAAARPRGYPGDADLIDYIYSQQPAEDTSEVGHRIFNYTTNSPACAAVRNRRDILRAYIDNVAAERGSGRVLSLASGHAREAQLATSVRNGSIEFVAMDQDSQTVRRVASEAIADGEARVHAEVGTVKQWLKGEFRHVGDMDLVYASGLYDYLAPGVATTLTSRLFDSLRAGGRLIVPNFLPGVSDVGYMECCMDWWLVYRDAASMLSLLGEIDQTHVASTRTFTEAAENIIFLEVQRA